MSLRNLGKTIQTQILYGLTFLPPPPPPPKGGMQLAVYSVPPLLFLFRNQIMGIMKNCGNVLIEQFREKWENVRIFGRYFIFRVRKKKPQLKLTDNIHNQYIEPTLISEVITPLENEYPIENKDGSIIV
jgi:hypothetical protein